MYERILVPVDGSEASGKGLDEAIKLARDLKASMLLVHIVEPWVMVSDPVASSVQLVESIRNVAAGLLSDCEARAEKAGIEVDAELIEIAGGSAGEQIVQKAKEFDADLIVCGTHGRRGIRRLLMGSDAEYIVRRAPVPVLLVRHEESPARE